MELKKLLEALKTFDFFTKTENDADVYKDTIKKIEEYRKIISNLSEEYGPTIQEIENEISRILKDAINGKPMKAYTSLKKLIEDNSELLYIHDLEYEIKNNINIYHDSNKWLFKGRVLDWNEKIDRKDIFHIPFDKRELISTQRFSINGVPCIYLGQSIHVVWEELNRPKLDELFVSRFEIDKSLKVFDIGLNCFDLEVFYEAFNEDDGFDNLIKQIIKKFVFTCIFKIACSVKVNDKKRPFKSEYVFPQLLMSVINESKIADGIRYSSVIVNNDSYIYANYAFACNQCGDEQYSKFYSTKMKLSSPVNAGLIDLVCDIGSQGYRSDNIFRNKTGFDVNKEYRTSYEKTKFFKIESEICISDIYMKERYELKAIDVPNGE